MRDAISARIHEIFDPKPERPRLSTSSPVEAPVTTSAPTPITRELYHGSTAGSSLGAGSIDPLKHSSGRTPLVAFTLGEEEVARAYAETGGVGQQKAEPGPLYKVGVEFDSPERIRKADDLASDEFIDFMRNSLPEQGVPNYSSESMGNIQSNKTVRFRDIFDDQIKDLKPEERTIYGVMDSLNNVHEFYRPLEKYDYQPRGQASIEARRFGIDALTWDDYGDDVLALLDPDDIRSNVGRRNITSVTPIGASAPTPAATASPSVQTLEPSDKPVPRPSWLDKTPTPAPAPSTSSRAIPWWLNKSNTPAPSPAPAAAPIPQPAAPTPQPVAPPPQPAATVTPRNQKPIGQPVQAAAPTSAPTAAPTATTKPVGRPVISVGTPPPPPTGAGAQKVSAQVTQTGNATPPPAPRATVQNNPPPPAKVVTSGAPTPRPILKKTGDDISQALLGGTKGTRNIKLAGAAALLGLGAFAVSRNARPSSDDYERKLEMQRRGMMM
jgi:hypothetical protein